MENGFCNKIFLFLGVHPDRFLKTWVYVFNVSILTCMSVFGCFKYYQDNDLGAIETICSMVNAIIKYSAILFGSKTIILILKAREQFWKIEVTDDQLTFVLNNLKRVDVIHRTMFTVAIVVFAVKPFVVKGTSIFNCYIFPELPYWIYYIMEFYVLIVSTCCFMAINVFVCSIITSVVVQFRYLNLKLAALKFKDVEDDQDLVRLMRDLKYLIRYQQFLMRYVEDLNKLLSVPLALLMSTSVSLTCLYMYVMSTNKSVFDAGIAAMADFIIIIEFFMVYGLPCQLLMDEATATADTIYYQCKWYLPKLQSLRNDLLFMILRNQEGVCIRAGNYHVVNNKTILLILKTTYTFYTFLQNVA